MSNSSYLLEQYPKNKELGLLSDEQKNIRVNIKHIKSKFKVCKKCGKKQKITEFYFKDKVTKRRDSTCRDCRLKQQGVIEIGALRFAMNIFKKGFRRCSVCKEIKPLNEYTNSATQYGGYSNNCYACSKKLHDEFINKERAAIGDFYVRQYALSNYGIRISLPDDYEKYRAEIIDKRKAKYFIDNREFLTLRDFARYIERQYGLPITMTEKRIMVGKTTEECKLTEHEMRSKMYTKGKIKVTDIITKRVFYFKNTNDSELLKMFSKTAVTDKIKSGTPTRITKITKYKNPCIIERIPN